MKENSNNGIQLSNQQSSGLVKPIDCGLLSIRLQPLRGNHWDPSEVQSEQESTCPGPLINAGIPPVFALRHVSGQRVRLRPLRQPDCVICSISHVRTRFLEDSPWINMSAYWCRRLTVHKLHKLWLIFTEDSGNPRADWKDQSALVHMWLCKVRRILTWGWFFQLTGQFWMQQKIDWSISSALSQTPDYSWLKASAEETHIFASAAVRVSLGIFNNFKWNKLLSNNNYNWTRLFCSIYTKTTLLRDLFRPHHTSVMANLSESY